MLPSPHHHERYRMAPPRERKPAAEKNQARPCVILQVFPFLFPLFSIRVLFGDVFFSIIAGFRQ